MQTRLFLSFIVIPALTLLSFSSVRAEEYSTHKLFSLKRSSNKNEVVYEVRLDKDGNFPDDAITAHWVLWEEGGKRDTLNFPEKEFAYGVKVESQNEKAIQAHLVSTPKCKIDVMRKKTKSGWIPIATFSIKGETIRIDQFFVVVSGSGIFSDVQEIQVTGTDVRNGKAKTLSFIPKQNGNHLDGANTGTSGSNE
ncbi:MAG: hypothetical protein CL678_06765 [Bdellovibrionaceae bacterium]|nr:hypothetical protein [Pseudobdellovibrionaceae bacterium]|tara:strand:- start:3688 stop:4272 length:585 start_codon:yes stop_codon:yes gene_type:complete